MPISLSKAISMTDSAFGVKNKDAVQSYFDIAQKYGIDVNNHEQFKVNKQALLKALLLEGETFKAAVLFVALGGSNEESEHRKDRLIHAYLNAYSSKGREASAIRRLIKVPLYEVSRKDRRNYLLQVKDNLPQSAASLMCFYSFSKWSLSLTERGNKHDGSYIKFDWPSLLAKEFGLS